MVDTNTANFIQILLYGERLLSFETVIKTTWAWMQAEGFTKSPSAQRSSKRAASTIPIILLHILTPPTPLPSVGVACPLYTDWKWVKDTLRNFTSPVSVWIKERVLLHKEVIWHSKSQSINKQINKVPKRVAEFHALAQTGHEQRVSF